MEKNESNNQSIELNMTSTGKVSYSVKAYGESAEDINNKLGELLKVADLRKKQMEGTTI